MKEIKHWAESLQPADRVIGTIRHKTDGTLSRHNVEMIVIRVMPTQGKILAWVDDDIIPVPFNELNKP